VSPPNAGPTRRRRREREFATTDVDENAIAIAPTTGSTPYIPRPNHGTSAPAATGTYWYVKERDFAPTGSSTKTGRELRRLKNGSVTKTPAMKLWSGAIYAETQETWTGRTRTRTIVDEDLRFSFASAADKAKWEAAGKPPLASAAGFGHFGNSGPLTSNYDFGYDNTSGFDSKHPLTMAGLRRLPTTAAGLSVVLRRMWNSDSDPDKTAFVGLPHPTFADYVFGWADSLLTGPATPGTRAAVYQLLAQQPGIAIVKSVTDPLGRTGVAVADAGASGGNYMIIDPLTAQLLAYTTYPVRPNSTIPTAGGGTQAYVAMGWTSQIGVPVSAQP